MDPAYTLVGQNLGAGEAGLVGDLHVLRGANHLGDSDPASDGVLPPDYAALDQRVRLHHCAPENRAVADPNACADLALRSDHHVWTKLCTRVHLGCRVDHDRAVLHAIPQVL